MIAAHTYRLKPLFRPTILRRSRYGYYANINAKPTAPVMDARRPDNTVRPHSDNIIRLQPKKSNKKN